MVSSPIVQGEDGTGAVPTGTGFEFGVDPNEDPELALALRVSMEEQRARQEAENAAGGKGDYLIYFFIAIEIIFSVKLSYKKLKEIAVKTKGRIMCK